MAAAVRRASSPVPGSPLSPLGPRSELELPKQPWITYLESPTPCARRPSGRPALPFSATYSKSMQTSTTPPPPPPPPSRLSPLFFFRHWWLASGHRTVPSAAMRAFWTVRTRRRRDPARAVVQSLALGRTATRIWRPPRRRCGCVRWWAGTALKFVGATCSTEHRAMRAVVHALAAGAEAGSSNRAAG